MLRGPWNQCLFLEREGDVPPSPPWVPSRGCFSLAISSGNFHCPGLFLLPSLYSPSPPDTTPWPQVFSPVITLALQPGSFSFLPQLRAFSVPCPVHSSSPPHSQHSLAQGKSCTSLAAPALVTPLPQAIYSTAVSLDCVQPQVQVPLPQPFPSPSTIRRTNLKLPVRAGKHLQQGGRGCQGMRVC